MKKTAEHKTIENEATTEETTIDNSTDTKNKKNKSSKQETSDKQDEKDEKEEEQDDLYREDSLALVGLSLPKKLAHYHKHYKKQTADMDKKEKAIYTIHYYKWHFLGLLLLLVCLGWTGKIVYRAALPKVLRVAVLNTKGETTADYITETFRGYYGLNNKNTITIYSDLWVQSIKDATEAGYTMNDYQTIGYYNMHNMIDVIIGDGAALRVYSSSDDTTAIDLSMDAALYKQIEEYVVFRSDPMGIKNDGEPYAAAIDISDTEFAKGCGLGYPDVYLMIPSTKYQKNDRTINLIKLIFGL